MTAVAPLPAHARATEPMMTSSGESHGLSTTNATLPDGLLGKDKFPSSNHRVALRITPSSPALTAGQNAGCTKV